MSTARLTGLCYPQAMPTRPSRPKDTNQLAYTVYLEAIGEKPAPPKSEREKNPAAVALGLLGGAKGGRARAARMTPEERAESARKAAVSRWSAQHRGSRDYVFCKPSQGVPDEA